MVINAKLEGYVFLIRNNRITIHNVPEPYKSAIIEKYPEFDPENNE